MISFQKVPWRELWIPDIGIYNGRRRLELNMADDMNRALIYSDGSILFLNVILNNHGNFLAFIYMVLKDLF